jgi:hypothetical protein
MTANRFASDSLRLISIRVHAENKQPSLRALVDLSGLFLGRCRAQLLLIFPLIRPFVTTRRTLSRNRNKSDTSLSHADTNLMARFKPVTKKNNVHEPINNMNKNSGTTQPTRRNDMEYEVSAGVTYAFNAHFSANLAYTYDLGDNALNNLPATLAPGYRSFEHNVVSLGVQCKF